MSLFDRLSTSSSYSLFTADVPQETPRKESKPPDMETPAHPTPGRKKPSKQPKQKPKRETKFEPKEVCKFYLNGACKKGSECTFAHIGKVYRAELQLLLQPNN